MNQFRFSCAADDLALFVSNGWHSLPPQVWFAICKLTGAKPPQWARTAGSIKTVDMQQLLQTCPKESQIIHWVFVGFVLKHYTSKAITPPLPPLPGPAPQGSRSPRQPWGPRESRPRLPGGDKDACPQAVTSEGLRGLGAQRLGWGVANTPTGPGATTLAGAAEPATAAARADSDGAVDASPTPPVPAGRGGIGGGRPGTASAAGA